MIPCCTSALCRIWHHWLNPLGNWNEPKPTPEFRAVEAAQSRLGPDLWWALRNPLHNFCHYWIGIVPLGARCTWRTPEENGWVRYAGPYLSWWCRPRHVSLPYFHYEGSWTLYLGWMSRGSFGMALRRNPALHGSPA
jgi:hypothetical protein